MDASNKLKQDTSSIKQEDKAMVKENIIGVQQQMPMKPETLERSQSCTERSYMERKQIHDRQVPDYVSLRYGYKDTNGLKPKSLDFDQLQDGYLDLNNNSRQQIVNDNFIKLLGVASLNVNEVQPTPHQQQHNVMERDNVMREFRLNGSDVDLDNIDPNMISNRGSLLGGVGSTNASLSSHLQRQYSWPTANNESPISNNSVNTFLNILQFAKRYASLTNSEDLSLLLTLPPETLHSLFNDDSPPVRSTRRYRRPVECAFCKNNGELESYYSSHTLKDTMGLVTCPVLKNYRCPRCNATGEQAHTIKYCPEAANDDHPSIASLRSYRLSSGKRRIPVSTTPLQFNLNPSPGQSPMTSPAQSPMSVPYMDPLWNNARHPNLF